MTPRIIQYTVRPDQVESNAALVRAVYAELAERRPEDFRYLTLRAEASFTHLAALEDGAVNPLPSLPAFQAFQSGIGERCEVAPVARDATVVGGYRLLVD